MSHKALWYLIKTKPRQESRALQHMENQGFTVYCPWFQRIEHKQEALFPGYVFLKNADANLPLSKVRSTRGVLNFVKFGPHFASLSDQVIEAIQVQEQAMFGAWECNPGDVVEILEGPFKALKAIYHCQKGEKRSIILLNVINQQQKVVINNRNFRKVL